MTELKSKLTKDQQRSMAERGRYAAEYVKWLAGFATIAIGGAGLGLIEKVQGASAVLLICAIGSIALSLLLAIITIWTLGNVVLVDENSTHVEVSGHANTAGWLLTVQVYAFVGGIILFALALGVLAWPKIWK